VKGKFRTAAAGKLGNRCRQTERERQPDRLNLHETASDGYWSSIFQRVMMNSPTAYISGTFGNAGDFLFVLNKEDTS